MRTISLIRTSVASQAEAYALADGIVEARLAACVQISDPGQSVYRWQGRVEHAAEYYLCIKTSNACSDAAMAWLAQQHSYELPEIIRTSCEASPPYVDWVEQQCGDADSL
jgi:periplasmic divalent cation tolerance protein